MTVRTPQIEPRIEAEEVFAAALGELSLAAAFVDRRGRTVCSNLCWRDLFADGRPPWEAGGPCDGDASVPEGDVGGVDEAEPGSGVGAFVWIAAGLLDVLSGRSERYSGECRTEGPRGPRDLLVRVVRLPRAGSNTAAYAAIGGAGGAAGAGGAEALVTCEDVTESRRARRRHDMHLALTRVFSESPEPDRAYPGILEAVCRGLDWDFGEIWTTGRGKGRGGIDGDSAAWIRTGEGPVLRLRATWLPPGSGLEVFAERSRDFAFGPGAGLPGRVWSAGRAEWVADVTTWPDFHRRREALDSGLRGAAAFPIRGPEGPAGVFVFFSRRPRPAEPETAAMMEDVGTRTGHFIVRREAERGLRESKAFYESLVETLPQCIYRTDLKGRVTFGNGHYCDRLGRPLGDLLGKTVFDLFPDELAAKYAADDRRVIETGRPMEEVERHAAEDGDRDGRPTFVQVVKTPVRDPDGRIVGIQGIFWDITERKRLEDDLRRRTEELERANRTLAETQTQLVAQERLAALGHLTAGVAHEVNTPIAFLNNNLAVIERDVRLIADLLRLHRRARSAAAAGRTGDGDDLYGEIDALEADCDADYTVDNLARLIGSCRKGLDRVGKIVADLRGFSRLDRAECDEADLDEGLEQTLELLGYELAAKSIVAIPSYGGLRNVPCRPAKLNQVFLNILLNAIQASPAGARLWVTTLRRTGEAGGEAVVEIRDEGCGMTEEVRKRIFDPFFTTKPVGEGTGLGLSICFGIIRDHGGRIEVESQPGVGSLFRIVLPICPTPMPPAAPAIPSPAERPSTLPAVGSAPPVGP